MIKSTVKTCFVFLFITTFVYAADENYEQRVSTFLQKTNRENAKRKIQELDTELLQDAKVQGRLLEDFFNREYTDCHLDIVRQLSKVSQPSIPLIRKAYKASDHDIEKFLWLCGVLGTKLEKIRPLLFDELVNPENRNYEGAIRVALFLNGSTSPENISKIITYTSPNKKPANDAIWLMALTGTTPLFPEEVHQNLVKNLSLTEKGGMAAFALGALKNKGKFALPVLKKHFQEIQNHPNLAVIQLFYGFSIFSIDPSQNMEMLRLNMRSLVKYNDSHHAGLYWGNMLADETMIASLIKMLNDKDPKVVLGSLMMLYTIGLPAQHATPQVLKIIESGSDSELRKNAAFTLGPIAPESEASKITQLIRVEKDDDVRQRLNESLKIIKESIK